MNPDLVYTRHWLPVVQEPACTILPFAPLSNVNAGHADGGHATAVSSGLSSVSVVVPVFNEAENVNDMADQIFAAMQRTGRDFEVVFVDDGSTDQTGVIVAALVNEHSWLGAVRLKRNFGQTTALNAGIQSCTGDYVVTLDGDLQNDPADIPAMLQRLDLGFDVVLGWRKNRHDNWSRKQASKAANWMIRAATGTQANDLGCTLKAMTRSTANRLELCGDMHRFIPVLTDHMGCKSCEVEVNHRPRTRGESKYGFERVPRVLQDLATLAAIKHRANPMRFFGGWSLRCLSLGFLSILTALACVLTGVPVLIGWATAAIALIWVVASIQLIGLGVVAELNYRNLCFGSPAQIASVNDQLGVPMASRRSSVTAQGTPEDQAFASFAASDTDERAA